MADERSYDLTLRVDRRKTIFEPGIWYSENLDRSCLEEEVSHKATHMHGYDFQQGHNSYDSDHLYQWICNCMHIGAHVSMYMSRVRGLHLVVRGSYYTNTEH